MRKDRAFYVETTIYAPMDRVWELTQDPQQHVRWDARFSRIVPAQVREDRAQEFRYELDITVRTARGTGVSRGDRLSPRERRNEPTPAFHSGVVLDGLTPAKRLAVTIPMDMPVLIDREPLFSRAIDFDMPLLELIIPVQLDTASMKTICCDELSNRRENLLALGGRERTMEDHVTRGILTGAESEHASYRGTNASQYRHVRAFLRAHEWTPSSGSVALPC